MPPKSNLKEKLKDALKKKTEARAGKKTNSQIKEEAKVEQTEDIAFSVVIIGRNESKTLPRLIKSMGDFIEDGGEVIYMDTGSEDDTPKIARDLGCKVHEVGTIFQIVVDEKLANELNDKFIVKGEERIFKAGRVFNFGKARQKVHEYASHNMCLSFDCADVLLNFDYRHLDQKVKEGYTNYDYIMYNGANIDTASRFGIRRFYDRRISDWRGITHEVLYNNATDKTPPIKWYDIPEEIMSLQHIKNTATKRAYPTGMALSLIQDPKNSRWHYYLARELYYGGLWKSALKMLTHYVTIKDAWYEEVSEAHNIMGECCEKLKDYDQAIIHYLRAFEISPNKRSPLIHLGFLHDLMAIEEKDNTKKTEHYRHAFAYGMASLSVKRGLTSFGEDEENFSYKPYQIMYRACSNLGDKYKEAGKAYFKKAFDLSNGVGFIAQHAESWGYDQYGNELEPAESKEENKQDIITEEKEDENKDETENEENEEYVESSLLKINSLDEKPTKGYLIISPQAGFGNRIRALSAGIIAAKQTGRMPLHCWIGKSPSQFSNQEAHLSDTDKSKFTDYFHSTIQEVSPDSFPFIDTVLTEWMPGEYWYAFQNSGQKLWNCTNLIKTGTDLSILKNESLLDKEAILLETTLVTKVDSINDQLRSLVYRQYFGINIKYQLLLDQIPETQIGLSIRRGNHNSYFLEANQDPTEILKWTLSLIKTYNVETIAIFSEDHVFRNSFMLDLEKELKQIDREIRFTVINTKGPASNTSHGRGLTRPSQSSPQGEFGVGLKQWEIAYLEFLTLAIKCQKIYGTPKSSFAEEAGLFRGKFHYRTILSPLEDSVKLNPAPQITEQKESEKYLILSPTSDTSNREAMLAAGILLAKQTGRIPYHFWVPFPHRTSHYRESNESSFDNYYIDNPKFPQFKGDTVDLILSEWSQGEFWFDSQNRASCLLKGTFMRMGHNMSMIVSPIVRNATYVVIENSIEIKLPPEHGGCTSEEEYKKEIEKIKKEYLIPKTKVPQIDLSSEYGKKIAILIPTTSNKRSWNTVSESSLFTVFLASFIKTCCPQYEYILYLGCDADDRLFSPDFKCPETIAKFSIKKTLFDNTKFPKGHVTRMWNHLFKQAYDDGCDYFYQCGDDISFKTQGWISACISILKSRNLIGVTSPIDENNLRLLTQSFVSRRHMEIFGYYFPDEIINWCCDTWIQKVYEPDYATIISTHICNNEGGDPRYDIVGADQEYLKCVSRDKIKLDQYLQYLDQNLNKDFYNSRLKKIISFSVYGQHPIYTYGAIENVLYAQKFYPGWICRFYYNDTVPLKIIEALKKFTNVELVKIDDHCGTVNMTWRFRPAYETDVDIMIVRDTDSRLNERDAESVKEWLRSNKNFHIIRDHPEHSIQILGGAHGCRNKVLLPLKNQFDNFIFENKNSIDQYFLCQIVYPYIKNLNTIFSHDEHFNFEVDRHSFPKTNHNGFIGEVIEDISKACEYLGEPVITIKHEGNHLRRDVSEKKEEIKEVIKEEIKEVIKEIKVNPFDEIINFSLTKYKEMPIPILKSYPLVTIAILCKDKAHILKHYLRCIYNLVYPKNRIHLYIRTNDNNDKTAEILEAWIAKVKTEYLEIAFDKSSINADIKKYKPHDWNSERFSVLGRIRQDSIIYAIEKGTNYFVVDCDNFIKPNTLEALIKSQRDVVGPLLKIIPDGEHGNMYSNFHHATDANGYYADSPEYAKILFQENPGLHYVDVIHCTYYIKNSVLKNVSYIDGTGDYEYVIFSRTLRKKGVKQYMDNREIYGLLTFDDTEADFNKRDLKQFNEMFA
jgi:glycosyltransferase involved in cell wall biosynthesis